MVNGFLITLGVAMLLHSGTPVVRSSQEQEVAALKKRAEAGDPKAQVQLGAAYASGDGVTEDDAEAVKWFRKAAEKGDGAGEYSLGEMYLTGRGVSTDLAEAVKWMRRAAEHDDARGEFNLAVMYAQGQAVPKDENEAAKWMRKAADQGLADGQFGIGSMYAHGRGVPQSAAEAANWYRKADQRASDLAQAINNTGVQSLTNVCTPAGFYVTTFLLAIPGNAGVAVGVGYGSLDYVGLLDTEAWCSKHGW